MAQPWLGVAATATGIAISLAFISLFDLTTFAGPVAFLTLCLIPMQVMVVVTWGANPGFAASMRQPMKGLVLLALTIAVAIAVDPIALRLVGERIYPPGPIPSHFVILVVPTTFWLAIMMGGWPFTAIFKNPVVAGVALLVGSYAVTYVVFRVFFNYDFLGSAPVHLASAPHGMFNAVSALVFYVTALAVMFLVLHFDLWPLTTAPSIMKQPVLGVVWTLIALAGAAIVMQVSVGTRGMDPMTVLTLVTAPFIFGTIVVLNMLQGSLFAKRTQPLKGVLSAAAAAVIGLALYVVYCLLADVVSGPMQSGPPAYDYEIWIANALLSVTFPCLIFIAAYFAYWPFGRKSQ